MHGQDGLYASKEIRRLYQLHALCETKRDMKFKKNKICGKSFAVLEKIERI
jgi:hypothetical protein